MTLSVEQAAYLRDLAHHAAHGAWVVDRKVRERSLAYLSGTLSIADRHAVEIELAKLAAFDPDHEWEAPTLTGKPTSFARQIFEELNVPNA